VQYLHYVSPIQWCVIICERRSNITHYKGKKKLVIVCMALIVQFYYACFHSLSTTSTPQSYFKLDTRCMFMCTCDARERATSEINATTLVYNNHGLFTKLFIRRSCGHCSRRRWGFRTWIHPDQWYEADRQGRKGERKGKRQRKEK